MNILEFPIDAEQNNESAKNKITMPVLVFGGDIYPTLGGDFPGNFDLNSAKALATNVTESQFHFQDIGFQKNNQNL